MDLRCPHRKFAVLVKPSTTPGLIEMSCPSRWCGKKPGVVVIHRFDTSTGALVGTRAFKDPSSKENAQ